MAAKTSLLQTSINARLEFDELTLRDDDVAACDPSLLKAFLLHRYGDAQTLFLGQAERLDPLGLLLLCDMLYRQWLYRDLVTLAPLVRERVRQPDLLARADCMLRRSAVSCGLLNEAEHGLSPRNQGTFADFLLRGDIWNATGRMELATHAYEQAIRMQSDNPMARLHYGFHLLKKGRLTEGLVCWGLSERIFGHFPLKRKEALWRGEPLGGRSLVVLFEHGFGDMIQFARYLKPLAERYPDVRIAGVVPAPIHSLLAASFPSVTFVTTPHNGDYDFHVAMTQLPIVLGVPFHEPKHYVAPPSSTGVSRATSRKGAVPRRIGVCWRGHPRQYEQSRSVALAEFATLFSNETVTFRVLLNSVTPAEQALLATHDNVEVPAIADFLDLARLIEECDAVVSVDTSIVHLAGAMGKPVILLSRPDTCWRWGASGTTSPWYDDIRIVRHPFDLDWPHVMAEARALIESMAATPQPRTFENRTAVA